MTALAEGDPTAILVGPVPARPPDGMPARRSR
jgi:hypothetical protein